MWLEEPNYKYSWSKKSTTEVELFKMVIIHFSDQNPHLLSALWVNVKKLQSSSYLDAAWKRVSTIHPHFFVFFTNSRFSVFFTLQIRCGWSQSWNAAVRPAVAVPSMAFQSSCNLIFMDSAGWNGQHNCPSCGMTFWVMWGIMNKIAFFF